MLASQAKKTVTIRDQEYGIRKLSWKTLEKAREQRQIANAQAMRAYGGDVLKVLRPETLSEAEKQLKAEKKDLEAKRKARYDAYDRSIVLGAGVIALPYDGDLKKNIDELEEDESEALHQEIVDYSLPPLDPAEAAAAGKGDSGASTSS